MLARLLRRATATSRTVVQAPRHRLMAATKPAAAMLVVDALIDLARDRYCQGNCNPALGPSCAILGP